ncbi:MAG TPA: FHA domain-containing protein [Polyangiaceae bacterium]|nr:FHA domain-containing protein [Polyangiaceae bacterium]
MSTASGSYVLVVHAPQQAPAPREFASPRVVIGRETGDLVLPDAQCSSTHAELLFDGHSVRLRDLGSTNGTWCNGQRIQELAWALGVSIQIGAHYITLHEVKAPVAARGRTAIAAAVPGFAYPGAPGGGQGPGPAPGAPQPGAPQPGPQGSFQQAAGGYGGYSAPQANAGYAPQPMGYGQPGHGHSPPHAQGAYHPGTPYAAAAPTTPGQTQPGGKRKSNALWIILPLFLVGTCGAGAAGLMWLGSRQPSPENGSASTATLDAPREATVKFVWFKGPVGPSASGGTSPARVRVAPNHSGVVSVGVAEEFAGGGGNQWRTATWLAAFNATRTLGASLADYEFNVHVGGHTDGPSAGMLTTTTMLSLLRGKPLREDSTMTGTINPDGTAGPVGGIVQKMRGAKEAGLKRFGFPIGTRNHKDLQTDQQVDLVNVASQLGLETREIGDVYDAYEFMTGDKLPRVEPASDADLEPSEQTQALLRAKVSGWKVRVEREIAALKEEVARSGKAVEFAAPLLAQAEKAYENAKRYESNSFLVPALDGYAETAVTIATATRFVKIVPHLFRHDVPALLEILESAKRVNGDVEAFGQELEVRAQSKTRGGQVSTTSAFTHYVTAKSATMIGDDFRDNAVRLIQGIAAGNIAANNQALQAVLEQATLPILYYDIARVYLDYAKDVQGLIADEGERKPLAPQAVDRLVAGYASASAAVLAYFNALIVDEIASDAKMSAEQAKFAMAQREPTYYLANKANMMSEYTGKTGATDGVKLMRLAAAGSAYLEGATLVNKWYSLGMNFDKSGELVLDNRRALTAELELARRNAREAAARSKAAAGFIPTAARLAYQTANARREGSDEDKLAALAAYWQSSFWSDLIAAQ